MIARRSRSDDELSLLIRRFGRRQMAAAERLRHVCLRANIYFVFCRTTGATYSRLTRTAMAHTHADRGLTGYHWSLSRRQRQRVF